MAAPVAAFTVIPLADVDPDSPVATDLMNALRLNDQNLFAQLVGDPVATPPFTPAAAHNHDGVNSKAVAGANLRFIAATEISVAVASVTFAGLLGNTDGHYILYGEVIASIAFTNLQLRFNALSTGYENSPASIVSGILILPALGTPAGGEFGKFQVDVFARNFIQSVNVIPSAQNEAMNVEMTPFSNVSLQRNIGARNNVGLPAPNITSLEIITATGGTPIGIGSRFALYKLAES